MCKGMVGFHHPYHPYGTVTTMWVGTDHLKTQYDQETLSTHENNCEHTFVFLVIFLPFFM